MVSELLGMFFSKLENMGWRHKFGSCQHITSHEIPSTREWLYLKKKRDQTSRVQRRAVLGVGGEQSVGVLKASGGQSFTEEAVMGWITCCSVKKRKSLLTLIKAVLCCDGVGVRDKSPLWWQKARIFMAIKTKYKCYRIFLKEKIEWSGNTKTLW